MVTVKKVNKSKIEQLVRISYALDFEGFDKYHLEKFSYDEAVQKTVSMIEGVEELTPLKYYEVLYGSEPIGYFVFFKECLYSFCIAKSHRSKKNVLVDFWAEMKKIIDDVFVCLLHKNNTRAIAFLQKMGMKVVDIDFREKDLITFINI